jgi:hypothetical protein
MTKGELRKARRERVAAGLPWNDDDQGPVHLGNERLRNGKTNMKRARYLEKCARLTLEYERDF